MYCFKCEKDTIKEVGSTDDTIFFKCTICNHESHVKKSLLDDEAYT